MAERTSPAAKRGAPKPKPEPPKVLTWGDIEAADDRPTDTVEVPEWGGVIVIRAMSQRQKQDIRRKMFDPETGEFDSNRWEDACLLACVIDPELTEERLGLLKEKSGQAVERLSSAVVKLNKQGGGELAQSLAGFL